ncbi:unnamed protein product [Rotaria socialis]|uniref:Uncharacterized protein n=3 Tax=Rotaria socialis TaxID=392032 RepID=A0A817TRA8_9BILA|nr:unnamed protein product [Rotaria socialis]CAF4740536.1 unnamed protein product [Rotaria socialis]
MTTVEFGGGPTLEACQQFANLKDGSEIPKYTGHIHQLRFRQGHTYGEETHILSKEFPHLIKRSKSDAIVKYDQPDPYVTRDFPDGLIPGYTGYVPQRKYQHGNRYRIETDACVTGTQAAYARGRQQIQELQRTVSAYPKTRSLNSGTVVKHFLDYHRAYHPNEISQQEDRRPFVEPPMPGYHGYVPRMVPIGVGLGSRYHEATKKSLHRFAVETTNSTTNFPTIVDNQSLSPNYATRPDYTRSLIDFTQTRPKSSSSFKIYNPTGMVPKYTGYLPQRKYRVGQTFGDTTRGLPVCSDLSSSSLGDFA